LKTINYKWNEDKNNLLKKSERNISFEQVLCAIENDRTIDIISSPTHKDQNCFVVEINDYAYVVPFAQTGNNIFFKTIYPSRKYTKYYLTK